MLGEYIPLLCGASTSSRLTCDGWCSGTIRTWNTETLGEDTGHERSGQGSHGTPSAAEAQEAWGNGTGSARSSLTPHDISTRDHRAMRGEAGALSDSEAGPDYTSHRGTRRQSAANTRSSRSYQNPPINGRLSCSEQLSDRLQVNINCLGLKSDSQHERIIPNSSIVQL